MKRFFGLSLLLGLMLFPSLSVLSQEDIGIESAFQIDIQGPTTMTVGEKAQLTAKTMVRMGDGSLQPLSEDYTWQSKNLAVATVTSGQVTALTAGEAEIEVHGLKSNADRSIKIIVLSVGQTAPSPGPTPTQTPGPMPMPMPIPTPIKIQMACFPLLQFNATTSSFLAVFNPLMNDATVKIAGLSFSGELLGVLDAPLKGREWKLIAFDNAFFNKALPVGDGRFYALVGSEDVVVMQTVSQSTAVDNNFFEVMNPAPINMILGSAYYREDESYETSLVLVNINKAKDVIIKIGLNSLAEGVEDPATPTPSPGTSLAGIFEQFVGESGGDFKDDSWDDDNGVPYQPLPPVQLAGDVKGVVQLRPREAKILKLSEIVGIATNKTGAVVLRADRLDTLLKGAKAKTFAAVIIYTAKATGTVTIGQLYGPYLPPGILPKYYDPKDLPTWATPTPAPTPTPTITPTPTATPTQQPTPNPTPTP